MVTKSEGGREGHINPGSVWHCSDRELFAIWTCCLSVNNLFPFLLATALLIGDVMMTRRNGVKIFFPVITPPIVLAHLIDFLIRRCHVNPNDWIFILQICSASPFQDINISAPILLALWMFISWIRKADWMGNWSLPIGQNLQRFAYSSRQCPFIKL